MKNPVIDRPRLRHTALAILTAASAASLLVACGGGGGGEDVPAAQAPAAAGSAVPLAPGQQPAATDGAPANPAPAASGSASTPGAAGTLAPMVVTGRITDAANLTVKRARYDASTASVRIDYTDSDISALRPGMVVEIEAEPSASGPSRVRAISARSFVEGGIEAIDAANRVLVVNGVRVLVPADTVFEGFSGLADPALRVGEFVEVYGFADAQDGATATRIERKPQAGGLRATGPATNLNAAAMTFTLHGKTVVYTGARLEGFAAGLAEGAMVRIKGTSTGPAVIAASEVRSTDDASLPAREGFRAEQEGVVSHFLSLGSFRVNGMPANAAGAEVRGPIANDAWVEIEGVIRGGVLMATKVENKARDDGPSGETNLVGFIAGLNLAANTFQVGDTTVSWDGSTRFDDITPAALANGMMVEVEGLASDKRLKATKIKQED